MKFFFLIFYVPNSSFSADLGQESQGRKKGAKSKKKLNFNSLRCLIKKKSGKMTWSPSRTKPEKARHMPIKLKRLWKKKHATGTLSDSSWSAGRVCWVGATKPQDVLGFRMPHVALAGGRRTAGQTTLAGWDPPGACQRQAYGSVMKTKSSSHYARFGVVQSFIGSQ